MKAFQKTVFRTVKTNLSRFAALTAIIMLGIAFVSGLSMISPTVKKSVSQYLQNQKSADVIVKCRQSEGFSAADLEKISAQQDVLTIQPHFTQDLDINDSPTRLYCMPLQNAKVNAIELIEGRLPQNANEALAERASVYITPVKLYDTIYLNASELTIVGIAASALTYAKSEEYHSSLSVLQKIIYLEQSFYENAFPVTDVFIRLKGGLTPFTKQYEAAAKSCAERIESLFDGKAAALSALDNKSYQLTKINCEKVDIISLIFPLFFIAVTALVALTTMTRLVEEERHCLACYKTLGYGNMRILVKYAGLSLLCGVVGCLIGLGLGTAVLPSVVYPAFETLLFMPDMVRSFNFLPGIIASVVMLFAVIGVTSYVVCLRLKERPAALCKPKAPQAGKKIFLEKITFIWRRLKFKYKSTLRNIFRYKKHLIMTVLSVAGSTALVLAGLGLGDVARSGVAGGVPTQSYTMISAVIIAFAATLCVLVIYNLTHMNVGERKREIATLKVLGYDTGEVTGYIYREVFIMALFGILLGLPLGTGLIAFVFKYLGFGTLSSVKWYSYFAAAALTVAFIGFVDLLLLKKIKNIDMTASLKCVE